MGYTKEEKEILHRARLLVGDDVLECWHSLRVLLFGVGGVGSWCAESLVRSGVSRLTVVDSDCVSITNVNRQLPATIPNIGRVKVDALRERLLSINPQAQIRAIQDIYNAENADNFDLDNYDVIIDAIDSLAEKAHLILRATQTKAFFVSSMGAALKMDPSQVHITEFQKVKGCPLARALRNRFKRTKTWPSRRFLCVYSEEVLPNLGRGIVDSRNEPAGIVQTDFQEGRTDLGEHNWNDRKAQINGTVAHITASFGFMLAGIILHHFYKERMKNAF